MSRVASFSGLAFLLLAGCAGNNADTEPDNLSLDGTWSFKSIQLVGSADRPNLTTGGSGSREFVFKGSELKCFGKDYRYQMDPTKTPMTIDIAPSKGGPAFVGIAQWEGPNLRLSIAAQAQPRPKTFGPEPEISKVDVLLSRE